ncbi:ABC transporter permease subunit [Kitasatospora sp. NRRL B-11411]|jgi:putative spermidine/putrescine transport system permease protein|uniref:ABC transporter permease n=1 Tax=Kitasatospora sp. NRRL B-11411 TaxID=1463822 RepID=UPI0004C3392D|nr:ABC transporter permease subunit [Kitasatospora sp. NRRL B-11411]MDR3033521.1 ABC transporter permease subunit [Kitasatospora sp.]WNW40398.1 ABC transporter permease subunit [Streptomyces sp. Li-HN-5-13]
MTTAPTPVPAPAAADPSGGPGAPGAATASPTPRPARRRPRGGAWLATVPLLAFFLIGFGLPAVAIVTGAFTVSSDAETGAGSFTTANLTDSVQGAYWTALLSSVKLSALTALIGTVLGVPIAQAVLTSRFRLLREAVLTASGVLANFGGLPLAFAFVATLGNAGEVTKMFHLTDHGWSLYSFSGLTVTYLYFLVPLMVLTITPALEGLRVQWREAAQNNRATALQYWRHVALPILFPSLLGGFVLLFGSAFAAYATAAAMVGATVPLISRQIADALSGNVLVGQGNLALALSLDMIIVAVLVMAVYLPLQRRSARWLS